MKHLSFAILSLLVVCNALAQEHSILVKAKQPLAEIQPTMWGIFFEDINFAADGGIYAELVKNRSFEFLSPLMGWKEQKKGTDKGSILVINRGEKFNSNPRFIRVTTKSDSSGYSISNEGFRGMGIKKNNQYDFSLWASLPKGDKIKLHIELANAKGEMIGMANLTPSGDHWQKYSVSFAATATEPKAQLNIWFEGNGMIDLDMISLFPMDTWKQRPGGLRADLVQLLADLKPGFIRFPGGCIVEGRDLTNRYQWKTTVGMPEERKLIMNRWNVEFGHRPAPDYFQTFGLGFFEYFQLAEDIGAEPLPILNCGMACQFNSAEVVPIDQLDPFIQDALDLIEFANGSEETDWGKRRAAMGHPAPFNLKMLGVGNEQWGPQYVDRYKIFSQAIKTKYPSIKLVNSVGPFPDGDLFNYLNDTLRKLNADLLDEHYYRAPDWFLKNAKRYDHYDRNGPQIFAGEYAAHVKDAKDAAECMNNWKSALAEAAFMTGLERNADLVQMASYAPLFAHVEAWQWRPDLIWFDNLGAVRTPNYYVQQLFSINKGTRVIPILLNNEAIAGQDSLFASACIDKGTNELIIKMVNTLNREQTNNLVIEGEKKLAQQATLTVLASSQLNNTNSFDAPQNIIPRQELISFNGKKIRIKLAPYSVNVIRIKMVM